MAAITMLIGLILVAIVTLLLRIAWRCQEWV